MSEQHDPVFDAYLIRSGSDMIHGVMRGSREYYFRDATYVTTFCNRTVLRGRADEAFARERITCKGCARAADKRAMEGK